MRIPTEPIGSIPRPRTLIDTIAAIGDGNAPALDPHLKPHQRVFVGVIATLDPRIETAEEVRDRVLEAAQYIPVEQLGTTDDCGFAPFCDDTSTSRETAFAKMRARVAGTALAEKALESARVRK